MAKRKATRTIDDFFGNKNNNKVATETAGAGGPSTSASTSTSSSDIDTNVPKVPKRKFLSTWIDDYEWLEQNESTGTALCKYCRDNPRIAGNTAFAKPTGSKTLKRETLDLHAKSGRHQRCVAISLRPKVAESSVIKALAKQDKSNADKFDFELAVKINTAYCIAKEEMSFLKMKPLLLLQKKNGLDITPTYANHVRCGELISTIASVQRGEIKEKIESNNYISVMFDGATDYSANENEVVYVRHLEDGQPVNRLVGLTAAESATADGVVNCLNSTFAKFKLPNWNDQLVGMCADGASVNLGQIGGVVAKLREKTPHIIDIHCMAHRLELALHDMQKQIPMVNKVDDVLGSIYRTYHRSPKSKRELTALCEELNTRFYNPNPVKGTRWVPHLDRALKQYLRSNAEDLVNDPGSYTAVQMHMESLAATRATPAAASGRAKQVAKEMLNGKFVAFCHFLSDVFEVVAELSLEFQKECLILPSAINAINDITATLTAMKDAPLPGGMLEKLIDNCLKSDKQPPNMLKFQSLQLVGFNDADDLLDNLQTSLTRVIDITIEEIDKRFSNLLGKNQDSDIQNVIKAFGVFHHDSWPSGRQELSAYGNNEIKELCKWFDAILQRSGCDTQKVMQEWRKMKMLIHSNFSRKSYLELYQQLLTKDPYRDDFRNILHIVEILLVLPISSANCERAFSAQKRIVSASRASMAVTTASDLIQISTEGPELALFDPQNAMAKWKDSPGQRKPMFKEKWVENIVCTTTAPGPSLPK